MDRSELRAALAALRPTLDERFQPPADWPSTLTSYRTEVAQSLLDFFRSDIPADWPFVERQQLAGLRRFMHTLGSPDGRAIIASIIDELLGPPVKLPNEDRDKWFYEERFKGTLDKIIMSRLAKKTKWEPITIQAMRLAAQRYGKAHNLPPIPARQRGRKARKSTRRKMK